MKSLVGLSLILLVGIGGAQTPPPKKPQSPPEKPKLDPKAKTDPKGKPEAKPKPKKIKDPVTIKITTTTGQGNKYAGTGSSKIFILLNGDANHKYQLTTKPKPFQRGAKDSFELKNIDYDPDKIESVRILSESPDMWKCETISFQFFKAGKESRVHRHSPAQYLSNAPENKKLHAKPYIDLKMKVQLEAPKEKEEVRGQQ